jgi:manganese/zinc/iron transport system permease protein
MSALLWIVIIALLVAVTCALAGSFLQLNRQPLMGDAMSHAVLPGIAVAFIISGSRDTWVMLPFAALFALILVWMTERIGRRGRLREDASMGIVFTTMFAIGVILISAYAGYIDLDLDCVLYGELVYAPWQRFNVGGSDIGPRAVWLLGLALIVNLGIILLMYKELKLSSFDKSFAQVTGIPTRGVHLAYMTGVALATVAAFESVGAILVVAFLIVPPAAARLMSRTVGGMLVGSVVFGVLSAAGGILLAGWIDTSLAGSMAFTTGIFFTLAILGQNLRKPPYTNPIDATV